VRTTSEESLEAVRDEKRREKTHLFSSTRERKWPFSASPPDERRGFSFSWGRSNGPDYQRMGTPLFHFPTQPALVRERSEQEEMDAGPRLLLMSSARPTRRHRSFLARGQSQRGTSARAQSPLRRRFTPPGAAGRKRLPTGTRDLLFPHPAAGPATLSSSKEGRRRRTFFGEGKLGAK